MIIDINDKNFEAQVIEALKPAVVDFWAPSCIPCRALLTILGELEKIYGEMVNFFKLNVDENPIMTSRYRIRSLPTIIFFEEGEAVEQLTGMVGRRKIEKVMKTFKS
jgi:thioredoxin 1